MSASFPVVDDSRWRVSTATAGQTSFTVPFAFQRKSDVLVWRQDLAGLIHVLMVDVDYIISGAASPAGGTVTLTVGAAAGEKIYRIGEADLDRLTSVVRNGKYSSEALDDDLDRMIIALMEFRRDNERSWKVGFGQQAGIINLGAAGRVAIFDQNGGISEGPEAGDVASAQGYAEAAIAAAGAAGAAADSAANSASTSVGAAGVATDAAAAASAAAEIVEPLAADIQTAADNIAAIQAAPAAAAAAAGAEAGAEAARDEAVDLVGGVGLSVVTVGTPVPFPTATLRPGYLYMDGSTFNAAIYPALYAALGNTNVLPDWRDRVARGNGTLAGAVGTFQADAMQGHYHNATPDGRTLRPLTTSAGSAGSAAGSIDGNFSHSTTGAPVTDGTNGAPRTATETRVRAAIVSWQIKAYGSIIDPGALDLVALEQQAIRKTPMSPALTQAEIGQVAANIGQAWEIVSGGIVAVGASVAQIDWSNLGVYRSLRLTGRFNPATSGSFLSWRAGPGLITPTDVYRCQSTSSVGTGVGTSSATGLLGGPLVSNTGNLDSAHNAAFEAMLFGFNTPASTRYRSEAGGLNGTSQDYSSTYDGFRNVLSVDTMLRIYASSGLIGSGSYFVLEGLRG